MAVFYEYLQAPFPNMNYNDKKEIFDMTYQINDTTTMVLADTGDTFAIDPMLIFMADGREVPVSAIIPAVQSVDVLEDPIADGFDVVVTYTDGQVSTAFAASLDAVATYVLSLAHQEPTEAAPAVQVAGDTTPATSAAQSLLDAAMALLQEDVNGLLDEESPLRIAFHIAQRVFGVDAPQITLADLDKVAELLTTSDRLTADAESTGKSIRRGKTKSAAEAAAAEARAAANIMARFLFADEDLELADFYNSNFTAWCSLGPWLRLYQQLILLRRSINGGNLGTLTLTRNQDTGNPFLKHPDGRTFSVADIPGYTTYVFDANDTTISAALSSGYRIHLDDRYATDDELRDRLLFGVSAAAGDYNCGLMYYLNDFEDDWAHSTCDDVIAIAANATPDDLLALFLTYSFGHWRNDPHSVYEIEDVVQNMAGRLRGTSTAPAEAAQDAAENVLDDTTRQYIAKRIRPRARRVVDMCDKCIRLRKENNHRDADSELTDIINTAKLLRLDAAGWIPMDEWESVNRRAAAATDGGGDPRYWGYIAAEYIKWADAVSSAATA